MNRVSVIIPTRNRPQLVEAAVRSVLQQTMQDVEIIVVIDGPDQATKDALNALHSSSIRIEMLEESVGGSEARNVGVRLARTPWVAFLDDDDLWLPNKLERQLQAVPADVDETSLCLVISKFILRSKQSADLIWPVRFPRSGEHISEYLFCSSRNVFQTSTFLCTRELMLQIPFTKGLKRLQDWDWLLRAMAVPATRLITVDEALSIYVLGEIATISKTYDWEGSLAWAKLRRELMTGRGYRGFISKKCAADAAQVHAPLRAVWQLFLESFKGSGWRMREPIFFLIYYLLSPSQRHVLGDRMMAWLTRKRA